MNRIPVLPSRLAIPETPPRLFLADHIKGLYDQMRNMDAVVICAPAGYGKTTFLSSFMEANRTEKVRVCWYSLDQEDQKSVVFLDYLIEALFPHDNELWKETHRVLEECGFDRSNIQYMVSVLCQEMWAYYHTDPAISIYIVFEDFHHVSNTPEIAQVVRYLFSNLPPNCSLFITSRYETKLFTEKLKLDRKILEISAEDLSFSTDDIYTFFSDRLDIIHDNTLIEKISQCTEGWIAGIVILYNAYKGSKANDLLKWIDDFGQQASIFNYFSSEILPNMDTNLLDFLVKASFLREFTIVDAETILDRHDVAQLLKQCESMGLFIQKTNTGETSTYRFHALFREVLLSMRPAYISATELESYNLKAANYFLGKKTYSKAIEHLLKCDDVVLINDVLLKESINMDVFEDMDKLHLLFDLLPESIISNNMILLFVKGLTYMHSNYEESSRALRLAFEKSKEEDDFLRLLQHQ